MSVCKQAIRVSLVAILLLKGLLLYGQMPDASQVDVKQIQVDQLSDEQIKAMIARGEQSGMSQQDILSAAAAKGLPQAEVDKLRARMNGSGRQKDSTSTGDGANRNRAYTEDNNRKKLKGTDNRKYNKTKYNSEDTVFSHSPLDFEEESIFGLSLFTSNKQLSFAPSLNIPTPKNYQLGAGDELIIEVWGNSQQTYQQKISPEGSINIPMLGPINVNGLTFEEATRKIKKEFTKIYAGLKDPNPITFLKVSLGATVRSIKVNIVGDAAVPGTYTLPSFASAFNALYAAGGISKNGTLRSVKVIRDNKTIADLDFYNYLLRGELPNNTRLEDQDVIFISPYTKRVTIKGEIRRVGVYDVKEKETLKDLLLFAGGYTDKTFTQQLKVIRKTSREYKVVDLASAEIDTFQLANGDEVKVGAIYSTYQNRVQVTGSVKRPGTYALNEANTLKKLILKADSLSKDAFKSRILVYRLRDDNAKEIVPVDLAGLMANETNDFELQKGDSIFIPSIFDLREYYTVQIEGAVNHPGVFQFTESTTIEDLIIQAGGLLESASYAHVEVSRRVKDNMATNKPEKKADIYQFPISKDLRLDASASKFVLQPFDKVFVRRSPGYLVQALVKVDGEIAFPGNYTIEKTGYRVSDLIQRSGGFTPEAYPKGAKLTRLLPDDAKQRNKTLVNLKKLTNDSLKINFFEDDNTATVVINLDQIMQNPQSEGDILLEMGDVLTVPKEFQTIRLLGAVTNPVMVRFDKSGVSSYVAMAGGFAENAKKRRVYVIYPNGEVRQTKRFLCFKSYPKVQPGSQIVVPQKPERKGMSTAEVISSASAISSLGVVLVTLMVYLKK
jgi:protein involved in polysaccharide export with SLBB domain